jgi:hypothetical protein
MRILVFLILLPIFFCQKPTIKNALRNQVIVDFKNAIVPIISKQVEHLKLPDVHSGKVSITNINIHINPFHPNQIGIKFIPNTSTIQFSAAGFGMQGSCHVCAKILFIKKCCDIRVSVGNAGFQCQISLLSVGGKPNIKADHLHVQVGGVGVHASCGFLSPIINLVISILKGHLVKEIVKNLESKVPGILTNEVNKKLNGLPTDIDIGPSLQIKYSFPYAPFVRGDYLFTGIYAFIHPKGNPTPPNYPVPDAPEFDGANPKGVQFFLTDYVVKSALDTAFKLGLLTAKFEKDMLGHHVRMECKAAAMPGFGFINAIDAVVPAECKVVFDRNENNRFTIIAELHVNLKEYAKAAVIFFQITEVKFNKLEYKTEKPIDIEWFKKGINEVLAVVIQIVNADLGQRGIPLPKIPGIDYTDMVQFIKNGFMEICATPVFHF